MNWEILLFANWLFVFYMWYEDMKSDPQGDDWMS